MQIIDNFQVMIELLDSIRLSLNTLIFLIFINIILHIAVAKNTRPDASLRTPGILSRLWGRLRRGPKLPKSDKKELTE
jgi:hypothetical protein